MIAPRFRQVAIFVDTYRSRSVCHIVVYTHRKGIWLLKNHTHVATKLVDIYFIVNVHVSDKKLPLDFAPVDKVVHTIEAFQKSGFSASRRTYESRDLFLGNFYIYVFERLKIAVMQICVLDGNILPEFKRCFLFFDIYPTSDF